MAKFQPFILSGRCVDVSFEGKGVFKGGDKVVFVDGILPEEEGSVNVMYRRNGTLFGRVKTLSKESPYRIPSSCPHFLKCGGCAFQNLDYQEELKIKRKMVENQLLRVGGISFPVEEVESLGRGERYRNKIQMPVARSSTGKAVAGFYKAGTHKLIVIPDCLLEDEKAHSIFKDVLRLFDKYGVEPYEEETDKGNIKHLLLRTSYHYEEAMLVLVGKNRTFPHSEDLVEEIVKSHPEIKTVVYNINSKPTNVVMGDSSVVLYGPGYIRERLLDIEFRISAKSFFQTNVEMAERLFAHALEVAEIKDTDVVFDSYSGIGTIGLLASKKAKSVLAVEIEKEAVRDARESADRNKIGNFEIEEGDATEWIENLARENKHVDVLFMDPPRKGSTPRFLDAVKSLKPSRVVYVSCNPATLARDLKELKDLYEIKSVKPFDMFPRTAHIETVVSLSLKR